MRNRTAKGYDHSVLSFTDRLKQVYANRIERPQRIGDIPSDRFFVYILVRDERPIIAGHGKKNRARVIFDSDEIVTGCHIKAMTVRLYTLFGRADSKFERYLIQCDTKEEAKKVEAEVHRKFGGNSLSLDDDVLKKLFHGVDEDSPAWMALRMALCSSFDGINDLKKWRRERILNDPTWEIINNKLKLEGGKSLTRRS